MSGSWACSPLQPHSSTALLSALLVDGWQVQVPKCPRDSPPHCCGRTRTVGAHVGVGVGVLLPAFWSGCKHTGCVVPGSLFLGAPVSSSVPGGRP